jgi:hypothetical protein
MEKTKKASALIVSLIIMSMMLIIGLGLSLTTIREQKATLGSYSSSNAYQTADSFAEKTIQGLVDANKKLELSDIFNEESFQCKEGKISQSDEGKKFDIQFMNKDGGESSCDNLACSVYGIKTLSVSSGKTERIIETPIVFPSEDDCEELTCSAAEYSGKCGVFCDGCGNGTIECGCEDGKTCDGEFCI